MIINPYSFLAPEAFSYANPGGQGDRTAATGNSTCLASYSGSVSAGDITFLVDGSTTNSDLHGVKLTGGQTLQRIDFDFGAGKHKQFNEMTLVQSIATSDGVYKMSVSDDLSAFTDISSTFNMNLTSQIITPTDFVSSGRYLSLRQTSGTTNSSPRLLEFTFSLRNKP